MQQFSLWLIPPAPQLDILKEMVAEFAADGAHPVFVPHLTLLGDIALPLDRLVEKVLQFSAETSPIHIQLDQVLSGTSFFMSFYALANRSPNLKDLHNRCIRAFPETQAPAEFIPHISLAYGTRPDGVHDHFRKRYDSVPSLTFDVDRISIVHSSKEIAIKDWRKILDIPLQGS